MNPPDLRTGDVTMGEPTTTASREPAYTVAEAARLLRLTPRWLRRWRRILGCAPHAERFMSFLELVELRFIKVAVDDGIGARRVRRAYAETAELLGTDHPFAHQRFFTDARGHFEDVATITRGFVDEVDFAADTGLAIRWYPRGRRGRVCVDPRLAFGAPVVAGSRIHTQNVYDLYLAESRKLAPVARWFSLGTAQIRAAVDFEECRAA